MLPARHFSLCLAQIKCWIKVSLITMEQAAWSGGFRTIRRIETEAEQPLGCSLTDRFKLLRPLRFSGSSTGFPVNSKAPSRPDNGGAHLCGTLSLVVQLPVTTQQDKEHHRLGPVCIPGSGGHPNEDTGHLDRQTVRAVQGRHQGMVLWMI